MTPNSHTSAAVATDEVATQGASVRPSRWSRPAHMVGETLARGLRSIRRRRKNVHPEAGDVPGWVMVTLMSALIIAGIYAVAGPALINLFNNAIGAVGGM